jgi:hypothetical protein
MYNTLKLELVAMSTVRENDAQFTFNAHAGEVVSAAQAALPAANDSDTEQHWWELPLRFRVVHGSAVRLEGAARLLFLLQPSMPPPAGLQLFVRYITVCCCC